MNDSYQGRFEIAVSFRESYKVGIGGTTKEAERILYYFAEKDHDAGIQLQVLNSNFIPSGKKMEVAESDFFENYKIEPHIYYDKVKPNMEALLSELNKGENHLEAGKTDKAEKSFKKALAYDSENLRAVFGLGSTYLKAGKHEDAQEVFEKIMTIELAFGQENKYLFNNFGVHLRKSGFLDMAKSYYQKALTVAERDENLIFNLGRVYYELKNFNEAMECADNCLSINPSFSFAEKLKIAALRELGAGK